MIVQFDLIKIAWWLVRPLQERPYIYVSFADGTGKGVALQKTIRCHAQDLRSFNRKGSWFGGQSPTSLRSIQSDLARKRDQDVNHPIHMCSHVRCVWTSAFEEGYSKIRKAVSELKPTIQTEDGVKQTNTSFCHFFKLCTSCRWMWCACVIST